MNLEIAKNLKKMSSSPTTRIVIGDDFGGDNNTKKNNKNGSSSSDESTSELHDLAQILRLMLIAENENAFRDVNVETLEQMIMMNDERDLIASFEMVSGMRPSSRVNVQQIKEEYKKSKKIPSSTLNSDSIIIVDDEEKSKTDNLVVVKNQHPIADDSIEIIMEDSGVRIPEPPVLEVEQIPIAVQMKLRVLKLKLNDAELLKEYSDHQLAQVLAEHENNVQSSADFIMQQYVKNTVQSTLSDSDSEDTGKYSQFTKDVLRKRLKMGGFTEYENATDETLSILLDVGGGDVECALQNIRGTNSGTPNVIHTARYISDPNLPWDKNPTKPITEEGKEALQKEGRSVTTINQLPYDTLEHVSFNSSKFG